MNGGVTQPPRADPALRAAKGRHGLVGQTLDEALHRCRGYGIDVRYGGARRMNAEPGRILLFVDAKNIVTAAR